jgi:UDP-2-acetamido-2,6-beta-L-arabino-hexul-4-ose reductase
MKIKIGITGQDGFLGKHLYNTIGLFPDEFERISYNAAYFNDEHLLQNFVFQCDVIVHLAALNRHNDPEIIYETNIGLVKKLIRALEITNSKAHILFSSSSQEERENLYGQSKREGRELFANWAKQSDGKFTGLIIPNVFGPFGKPYYNSFIATFSHQLTHNKQPVVEVDGLVKLIFVNDLVKVIISEIRKGKSADLLAVAYTDEYKVSYILKLLKKYEEQYFSSGIIPELKSAFEINLFNTFRSYIDQSERYPSVFNRHADSRGAFVELIKLNTGGQVSFSTTMPGITRGNHFHTRKIERFAVIKGKALIQLRRIDTDEVLNFKLDGDSPSYVDMPVWYTHNIKNIGEDELYTVFWINEFFDPNDADTYMETV